MTTGKIWRKQAGRSGETLRLSTADYSAASGTLIMSPSSASSIVPAAPPSLCSSTLASDKMPLPSFALNGRTDREGEPCGPLGLCLGIGGSFGLLHASNAACELFALISVNAASMPSRCGLREAPALGIHIGRYIGLRQKRRDHDSSTRVSRKARTAGLDRRLSGHSAVMLCRSTA